MLTQPFFYSYQKEMNKMNKLGVGCLSLFLLVGCASQQNVEILEKDARFDANGIKSRSIEAYENTVNIKNDNYVVESKLPLLTGRVAPMERELPDIFKASYGIKPNEARRLVDIIKRISAQTGMVITARDDVFNPTSTTINTTDKNGNIDANSVNIANTVRTESNLDVAARVVVPEGARYSGTVKGFFDYLCSILNISWEYLPNENRILLTRYIEESYPLFVPPSGDSEGIASNIWNDTQDAISNLLSQGGSVKVNQGAGIISVVDTKDVQGMVRKYLLGVNNSLRKGSVFKLEVLSFEANDREAKGIDLSLVHSNANSTTTLFGGGVSVPGSATLTASVLGGELAGSSLVQQNLSEKLEVNVVLSRVIRSMNNQPAEVDLREVVPVLSSYTPPVITDGTVTPGGASTEDIEVGFKLKLTPSIMKDGQNLAVRINLETSTITELVDIPLGNEGEIIQSARQKISKYDHTFSIRNAETLVISGYNDRINEFKSSRPSSNWLSWLFSSAEDTAKRTYYVILLTPQVSNGSGMVI